jgi:hypothetical protein
MYSNFHEEGCNFFLKKMSFLIELQPGILFNKHLHALAGWDKINSSPVKTGFLPVPFIF